MLGLDAFLLFPLKSNNEIYMEESLNARLSPFVSDWLLPINRNNCGCPGSGVFLC